MAEFLETRIANLEKPILQSIPSRTNRKNKRPSNKRKLVTFPDDENLDQGHSGKTFCKHNGTSEHTTEQCTILKALVKQTKQKKSKQFDKEEK